MCIGVAKVGIGNNNIYNNNKSYYSTEKNNSTINPSSNEEIVLDSKSEGYIEWKDPSKKIKKCVLTGQNRISKDVKDISFLNKHGLLVKLNSNSLLNSSKNNSNNSNSDNNDNDINNANNQNEEVIREDYDDTFEVIKTKKQKQLEKNLMGKSGDLDYQDSPEIITSKKNKKKQTMKEDFKNNEVDIIVLDENVNSIKPSKKSKKKSILVQPEDEEVSLEVDQNEIFREYNLDENGEHIVTMSPGFKSPELDRIKSNLEKPLKESKPRKKKVKEEQEQPIVKQQKEKVSIITEKEVTEGVKSKIKKEKKDKLKNQINNTDDLNQVQSIGIEGLKSKKKRVKVDEYLNIIDVYKEWKATVLSKSSKDILTTKHKLPNKPIKMQSPSSNAIDGVLEKEHEWDSLVDSCNRMVFGNSSFRPLQQQVINSILHGRDTFVSLPTGGGKSLCFQIPSLVDSSGISIVLSPLLSLMQDQVHKLKLLGVPACSINSSNTPLQNRKTIEQLLDKDNCNISIVYVSPERLSQTEFLEVLNTLNNQGRIKRLIVDEAHCISEWGHDFRPAYRKISLFRENFPNVPIAAFTATAKPSVESDIKNELKLHNPVTIASSFLRTNLLYQIRSKSPDQSRSFADIADYIKMRQSRSCGIIYCATTNDCELLSQYLNEENIDSHFYHGSLKNSERVEIQKAWTNKSFKIIVTTLAFGMGIDVKDVRFIIHYTMPSSIEAYYQQTGRAGRDGLPSECILYYTSNDYFKISRIIQTQAQPSSSYFYSEEQELVAQKQQMTENKVELLDSINSFCRNDDVCRRVQLLDYFGEVSKPCKTNCDICISQTQYGHNNYTKSKLKQLKNDIQTSQDSIERVYTRNSYSTFKYNKKKSNKSRSYEDDDTN
ncbi:hypothetical protein DICPUDRAFT_157642 [Dictyostelium purpureum]|uniref:ATP-dependent DNA helicase n=1 Tax=Dictyostelium purpureum TaxID=5786 RepID=F0ZZN1_DICPU|nr:uncharacterized protein DICPUDRAFT_157642 [Dictyostelium purpureum]EGC30587.1 hypothetical protein DICPUDRAFT_157642 [Dictyostelium purpureum]|eukprot:XP_003292875.1 hypothetical protein DICPUDRAFT_157642 [Dictyostelium purpureum]